MDAITNGSSITLEFETYSKPSIPAGIDSKSTSKSLKPAHIPIPSKPLIISNYNNSVSNGTTITNEKVAEELNEYNSVPNPYYRDPNDPDAPVMVYPDLNAVISTADPAIDLPSSADIAAPVDASNVEVKFIKLADDIPIAYHISVKKGIAQFGDIAVAAIRKEMVQMVEKSVFQYVHSANGNKIIRSSTFLKEKLDANGKLLLIKARLVADGSMQTHEMFENSSSPTVKTSSTFIMLKIAVVEHRSIAVIDIGGAYLNANMDTDVFMSIDSNTANILVSADPSAGRFVQKNGSLLVKLKKALYGCRQSGRLWYNCLSSFLIKLGFVMNAKDACVFNLVRNGVQLSLLFHVDDVLMTSVKNENIIWLQSAIKSQFLEIKEQNGDNITYLGMQLESLEGGSLKISMNNLLSELIVGRTRNPPTPANENLFVINDGSGELDNAGKQSFHSLVAKLLYLSRMVRPDIAVAVAYLTTRVKSPNQNDLLKLQRVLDYLSATKDTKLIISDVPFTHVDGLIDASFALHEDGKSHTGFIIELGGTPVSFGSTKQHIITVNSTEAELVALSDKYLNVLISYLVNPYLWKLLSSIRTTNLLWL